MIVMCGVLSGFDSMVFRLVLLCGVGVVLCYWYGMWMM